MPKSVTMRTGHSDAVPRGGIQPISVASSATINSAITTAASTASTSERRAQ